MFNNETVIVLGAGASWHYSYPTGEGLVESVISMAHRFRLYCLGRVGSGQTVQEVPIYVERQRDLSKGNEGANAAWRSVADECELFISRIETVRPLVIDYFLGWNPSLQPIGKLMIAAVILECEAVDASRRGNQNRVAQLTNAAVKPTTDDIRRFDPKKCKDDWYRFIIHKFVIGCKLSSDILANNVRFITFNYDASLEYHLSQALASIDMLNATDIERFLTEDRIIHVYGSVHSDIPNSGQFVDAQVAATLGNPIPQQPNFQHNFQPQKQFLDRCLEASEHIRTIDPHDKEDDAILTTAKQWTASAKVLYLLGYGFDENNNRRIGLDEALNVVGTASQDKIVMFTNYRGINTISKRASKLMYHRYDQFMTSPLHGNPKEGRYAEMSVRDVYEALELDFAAMESELISGTALWTRLIDM